MIAPYTAVGLIPTFWGARRRDDIRKNLEHLAHLTKAAVMLGNLEIPVRLVVIPEGALQGFNDEVVDVACPEEQYVRRFFKQIHSGRSLVGCVGSRSH